jgi:hypothetical protein
VLSPLGMQNTFVKIPTSENKNYSETYSSPFTDLLEQG